MRASKEAAEQARQELAELAEAFDMIEAGQIETVERSLPRLRQLSNSVGEFLNVAKRRLPTEAAYDRDRQRRK